jgi:hypothetical protein
MFWKKKPDHKHAKILNEISNAWGWVGIAPIEIVHENDFGNLIIKDKKGKFWRLCPEDVYCKVIASSQVELDNLLNDKDFKTDWAMTKLADEAKKLLGPLSEGRKYCLKIPGFLGGSYTIDNIGTNSLFELVGFSGSIGYQTKNLPDGTEFELEIKK